MADQLLDYTGLGYFKQQCDAEYGNRIETVKVNGTALTPDAAKAVNVEVPTVTSLTQITGYTDTVTIQEGIRGLGIRFSEDANGVRISTQVENDGFDKVVPDVDHVESLIPIKTVKVNGTALTPDAAKAVDVETPTMTRTTAGSTHTATIAEPRRSNGEQDRLNFTNTDNGLTVKFEQPNGESRSTFFEKELPDEARVAAMIAAAQVGVTWDIVTDLPATGEPGKMYLKGPAGSGTNIYEEWIWINSGTTEAPNWHWENIGTTAIDLSNYVQKDDIEIITTTQIDALFA